MFKKINIILFHYSFSKNNHVFISRTPRHYPIPGTAGMCSYLEDCTLTPIQRLLTNSFTLNEKLHIHLMLAEERQRWWWRSPAFIGYLCSSIRTLPHKYHLRFLLVSTLWRINLQVWTWIRALFKLLLQNSSQICSVKRSDEPSHVYISSTCSQDIRQ